MNVWTALAAACLSGVFLTTAARAQGHFWRGDSDLNGAVELTDGVVTLNFLFTGGVQPLCMDAADANDTGTLDLADAIYLFNFLFQGGPRPAAPYPSIDADPTDDDGMSCFETVVDKTGDIAADETWANDAVYRLISAVIVKDGATLTIERGTTVLGDSASQGLLVVERGGRLVAEGTATQPIVFTSDKPVGQRARGDWGGLILLGNGDSNTENKQALAEGLENTFWGGGDSVVPNDDSGILSYVRVEFGGTEISPDNEVNAISMFGVGSGTRMDHVMVKYNLDDGFEWFGGAVDLTHAIAVGIGDDSFDYSFGTTFNGQFWVAQQRGDDADRGFEVDNHETAFGSRPLTLPTISNVTLVGDPDTDEGTDSTTGVTLRRGTGTRLYNAVIAGFKSSGLDLDDGVTTSNNVADGTLVVDYSVFHNNGPGGNRPFTDNETEGSAETAENGFNFTTVEFATTMNTNNVVAADSPLVDPYNLEAPNFRPQNDALTNPFDPTTLGSSFVAAPYRGAVAPDGSDWTQMPWVSYAQN